MVNIPSSEFSRNKRGVQDFLTSRCLSYLYHVLIMHPDKFEETHYIRPLLQRGLNNFTPGEKFILNKLGSILDTIPLIFRIALDDDKFGRYMKYVAYLLMHDQGAQYDSFRTFV